jgi:hypothetical protein
VRATGAWWISSGAPRRGAARGLTANLIPVEVLKSISQAELFDRLTHAEALVRKAQAATEVTDRRGYNAQAQAVLRAQPRAVTEREVAARITKAAGLGNTGQADALRRQAQDLLAQHPPAPRRGDAPEVTVAKGQAEADDDDLMPCYNQAGMLFGVCPRSALQPITSYGDQAQGRPEAGYADAAPVPVGKSRAPVGRPGRR